MSDNQQQIAVENPVHALMNVMIDFDEESFRFLMMSGGPARMYSLSPKHAKRILLLLGKQMEGYEKKFGKVEAALPQTTGRTASSEEEVGFKVPQDKKK